MTVEIHWRSERGGQKNGNQDYCGVGLRPEGVLCVVLDGFSTKPKSGELVRLVAKDLIDWFMSSDKQVSTDELICQMREIHKERLPILLQASASYLIVLIIHEQPPVILYSGDCLMGYLDKKSTIHWQIQPHTLANATCNLPIAELAESALRNKLTQSFRANQYMIPNNMSVSAKKGETLVIATDGFWAELNEDEQGRFLADEVLPKEVIKDDCSALNINIHSKDIASSVKTTTSGNVYVVQSDAIF